MHDDIDPYLPASLIDCQKIAVSYGARACTGGLGHAAAGAITQLRDLCPAVTVLGPGYDEPWSLPGGVPDVSWIQSPDLRPSTIARKLWLRRQVGRSVLIQDQRQGRWVSRQLGRLDCDLFYTFTQIAYEPLQFARKNGIATILENPNGHLRNFAQVYENECRRFFAGSYTGHPTADMIARVEEEYQRADLIRVYSTWARESLMEHGVPAKKIWVHPHAINTTRFAPSASPLPAVGPLRLCFVGSLCMRKGFWYLLRAMRLLGPTLTSLHIVGATGGRYSAQLFRHERNGLQVTDAPGDPLPAYQQAEVLVVPTLEDGFGFVVGEAMACGIPVIVTEACGAKDWVTPGRTGWIVPARDEYALAAAIQEAHARRSELPQMGRYAQQDVLERTEALGALARPIRL